MNMYSIPGAASLAVLHWDLCARNEPVLDLRCRRVDDFTLSLLTSGACEGRRNDSHLRMDGGDYVGVSCVLEGKEILLGSEDIELHPNDILVWRNEGEMGFSVPGHLSIFTILMPQSRFSNYMKCGTGASRSMIPGSTPIGSMMAAFLRPLAGQIDNITRPVADAAVDMALEMVGRVIDSMSPIPATPARVTLFHRIVAYINRHLDDPDLSPPRIATAHGISTRYLHMLFANNNKTVAGWIREHRIQRCREALETSQQGLSLAEIAHNWGFSDVPHFSRTFKKRFGISPKAWRMGHRPINIV